MSAGENRAAVLDRLGDHAPVLSKPGEVPGLASSWLANRMVREFKAEDDVAPLAIEGVLLEILAESARAIGERAASNAPSWLRRVKEALEDSYLLAPSLADSRDYRAVSIQCIFRASSVNTTNRPLANSSASGESSMLRICSRTSTPRLSEVAMTCGFSDQSHFCAMFKSTPG